ncbi:MAG: hypothetical protein H6831_02415 [Planctomycetes bacterium]|nr:hypothetical protein [Planctomycetota bacterium]
MLTTALLTLVAALALFASGRLLLAFLPPGWPGWAPGLGTRELGATVGASWLLGSLAHAALAMVTIAVATGADLGPPQTYTYFAIVYGGVHAILVMLVVSRAPAKLRPRHEAPLPRTDWFAVALTSATVAIAAWIARGDLEDRRVDFAGSFGDLKLPLAFEWLALTSHVVIPLALTLLLVGALRQLGLKHWGASLVGLGTLASYVELVEDPFRHLEGPHLPPLLPLLVLLAACVLGLVWARRADRRARTIGLLLLSTLPLSAGVDAAPLVAIGLCIVLFALPAGGRRPASPWVLLVLTISAVLGVTHLSIARFVPDQEFFVAVQPRSVSLPEFENWRAWLAPPAIALIASWYSARRSKVRDEPHAGRLAWALAIGMPLLLAMAAWLDGAVQTGIAAVGAGWGFTLPYLVLGWTPALLVFLAIHFGPREAHADVAAADPT